MLTGYIKLHRSLLEWEWYDNQNVCRLWMHLLLKASFRETKWHGQTIMPGQLITSRARLAKETGLSTQTVRTSLERLISTSEITSQTTSRFSLITLINWDKYQSTDDLLTNQTTSYLTSDQPASNQQVTSDQPHRKNIRTKECKEGKEKNDMPPPLLLGYFQNVRMTEAEYGKLIDYCGDVTSRDRYVERLSGWLQQISPAEAKKKYSSHYATIQNWVRRDGQKGGGKGGRRVDETSTSTRYGDYV